jgi:hypothetical protein
MLTRKKIAKKIHFFKTKKLEKIGLLVKSGLLIFGDCPNAVHRVEVPCEKICSENSAFLGKTDSEGILLC